MTTNPIFARFTPHQEDYIRRKIPATFGHEFYTSFFEGWVLNNVGICLYASKSLNGHTVLFEVVNTEGTIHQRISVDDEIFNLPTKESVFAWLASQGVESCDVSSWGAPFSFESTFHTPEFDCPYRFEWHDK